MSHHKKCFLATQICLTAIRAFTLFVVFMHVQLYSLNYLPHRTPTRREHRYPDICSRHMRAVRRTAEGAGSSRHRFFFLSLFGERRRRRRKNDDRCHSICQSLRQRENGEGEGVCSLCWHFKKGKCGWGGRREARALLHFMGIPQSEETVIKMQCGREGGRKRG